MASHPHPPRAHPPASPVFSLLRLPASLRILLALLALVPLWLAIYWALQ